MVGENRKWGSGRGGTGLRAATHKLGAATVQAVAVQVAVTIAGRKDAAQLAVPRSVERVVGSEHEQPGHVPPAYLLLERAKWGVRGES